MSTWRPLQVQRFDREPTAQYERRKAAIRFIVEGFRSGRFSPVIAERMDEILANLRRQRNGHRRPNPSEADYVFVEKLYSARLERQDVMHWRLAASAQEAHV